MLSFFLKISSTNILSWFHFHLPSKTSPIFFSFQFFTWTFRVYPNRLDDFFKSKLMQIACLTLWYYYYYLKGWVPILWFVIDFFPLTNHPIIVWESGCWSFYCCLCYLSSEEKDQIFVPLLDYSDNCLLKNGTRSCSLWKLCCKTIWKAFPQRASRREGSF